MQPLSGPGMPVGDNRTQPQGQTVPVKPGGELPLTPAQRTTLEKLIVKLMALTPIKSAEIWANLRHDLSLPHDAEITASQFPQAQTLLQGKLTQAQDSHASRQLMLQLTELLPLGNNRQAVSDFIRQNFGHTVLSQLTHPQLQQVLDLIQTRQMNIPQPQQTPVTDRPLLPAEHNSLQQLVTRLSAATGEAPVKVWQQLFNLVGVKVGEPIPAKHFQLLSQFMQVKASLSQQTTAPTLTTLLSVLKQPASTHEIHQLTEYADNRFSATLSTPLTQVQVSDLIGVLFSQRVDRSARAENIDDGFTTVSRTDPQPIMNPFVAMLPPSMQALGGKPLLFIAFVVVVLLLWALF
ncbi:flagella biosynthesis regulator Flk [Rahnella sp. PCH160]|uniref:flagella biosynthesis regulator Flk n=1 Tax=Rahnella sp. PCH160 TaxID=3447928 RepID=UPI0039FD6309